MKSGDSLGSYRIQRVLGEGGMATVYLGRHEVLGSVHALKVLRVDHESVRRRLIEEGRAQAGLKHPNVVQVTDIIDSPTGVALVMEYVNGPNLAEYQRGRVLPFAEARELFRGILLGVAAAHRHHLVHRDLKPENILLERTELGLVPKVSDFGLVKIVEGSGTKSGVMMGTPEYMAPEQARNAARVDARADLWSLGAILYEMVTGTVAFHRADVVATYTAIVTSDYSPLPEAVPVDLREAVEGLLCVERAERFATVGKVYTHLFPDETAPMLPAPAVSSAPALRPPDHVATVAEPKAARVDVPTTRPSSPTYTELPRRRSHGLWPFVALVVCAMVLAVGGLWWRRPVPRPLALEVVGAGDAAVAVFLDGARWRPGEPLPALLPGTSLEVGWLAGRGCEAAERPADPPSWCARGWQEVFGEAGAGEQTVRVVVEPPSPRVVQVPLADLSGARLRGGAPWSVTPDGATGEVWPGRWELVLERGVCRPEHEDCASRGACPDECVSQVVPIEVAIGDGAWRFVGALPELPRLAPPDVIAPVARPMESVPPLVSAAAFRAFVDAHPAWGREVALADGRADAGYLGGGLSGPGPVLRVTWEAAQAYCASRGGLLAVEASPTTWDEGTITQEWRQASGGVAWRRFDGVSSTKARTDRSFPRTGFRCAR